MKSAFAFAVAFMCTIPNISQAQQGGRPSPTPTPTLTGKLWVVFQYRVLDQQETDLADFNTEEEAKADADRRQEKASFWSGIIFDVKKRKGEPRAEQPSATTITPPKTQFVDPGPYTKRPSSRPLAGWEGWLVLLSANAKGKITFGQGTFVVSDGIKGQGTWEQFGDGVLLKTETSEYRGKLKGSYINGVRFFTDGKRPFERFLIYLSTRSEPTPQPEAGQEEQALSPNLAGTSWKNSNPNDIFGLRFIDFYDGGTLVARYNVEADKFNGTWRSLGGHAYELTLRSGTYKATISGSRFKVSNVTMLKK